MLIVLSDKDTNYFGRKTSLLTYFSILLGFKFYGIKVFYLHQNSSQYL